MNSSPTLPSSGKVNFLRIVINFMTTDYADEESPDKIEYHEIRGWSNDDINKGYIFKCFSSKDCKQLYRKLIKNIYIRIFDDIGFCG